MQTPTKLTHFSHGAGCGCKIAPDNLNQLLRSELSAPPLGKLLVGNRHSDDAAVYDLGDGRGIISTTDFFTPIVDDPFDFGRIAAANALSDIYAMGGTPLMAIAIFGWPIDKLPLEIGRQVIEGGRETCHRAGIHLAGGHSIDTQEPIFGLAASGSVALEHLKQNSTAEVGDSLYLTKPIGVGILTTAEKRGLLADQHRHLAVKSMLKLNDIGVRLASISGVTAMTDVTGFGVLGHLLEVCRGSGVAARLNMRALPVLDDCVHEYRERGAVPGGSARNWRSYGAEVTGANAADQQLLCDPQTSGGLLIAVRPEARDSVVAMLDSAGCSVQPIGELLAQDAAGARIEVVHQ